MLLHADSVLTPKPEIQMESGFSKNNIIFYKTTLEAHNNLSNIINSGDVIVFQNDLTDNYF
jgi:hypothetical protein